MTDPQDTQKIFDDFGQIFGDLFAGGGKRAPGRGADLEQTLPLTLHDAVHGTTREVVVERRIGCTRCKGSGGAPGATRRACEGCGGRGKTERRQGAFVLAAPCARCKGSGGAWDLPCSACAGEGSTCEPVTLKVTVPPSMRPQQRLRLAGQGHPPLGDASAPDGTTKPGDLYLAIAIELPRGLSIEGDDLVAHVHVDAARAAQGGVLSVPWIDGRARVALPAHAAHGTRLVKRGWGLLPMGQEFSPPPEEGAPYRTGERTDRGNLVVVVQRTRDPAAVLEDELAQLEPGPRPAASDPAIVRATAVGLAVVVVTIGYLLLSR